MSFAKSSIIICLVLYGQCFEMVRWVRICIYKTAFLCADVVSSREDQNRQRSARFQPRVVGLSPGIPLHPVTLGKSHAPLVSSCGKQ